MKRLTQAERDAGIGYKSLIIVKDRTGQILRVSSPITLSHWKFDGDTWSLSARHFVELDEHNTYGIYTCFEAREARKYLGTLCKVALSGQVAFHEHGARGQFARLLEIENETRKNSQDRNAAGCYPGPVAQADQVTEADPGSELAHS